MEEWLSLKYCVTKSYLKFEGESTRTLYNEKIKPRVQDLKTWWKNIKKIVGKKHKGFVLIEPASDTPLNPKETASHMNDFFTNLTSDFPEVRSQWSYVGVADSLRHVTFDSVEKKLSG